MRSSFQWIFHPNQGIILALFDKYYCWKKYPKMIQLRIFNRIMVKQIKYKFFFVAVARGSKQSLPLLRGTTPFKASVCSKLYLFFWCVCCPFLIQCTNVRWLKAQKRTKLFLLQQISMVIHILFHHLSSKLFFACNINIFFW